MTRHQEQLCAVAARHAACPTSVVHRLLEQGLLDLRRVEALAIRERITDYQRQGVRRCDAMQWTAEEFCCSYEKVRHCFYQ